MDMFCSNCGNRLSEGSSFCSGCGAKIQVAVPDVCTSCGEKLKEGAGFCSNCGKAVNPKTPEPMESRQSVSSIPPQHNTGLVGFTDRCNSPEILAVAKKNKKVAVGFLWILFFVALIGFPVGRAW